MSHREYVHPKVGLPYFECLQRGIGSAGSSMIRLNLAAWNIDLQAKPQ